MDGMSEYFESVGIHLRCEGSDLKTVLSGQPISWSTPRQNFGGGLGMQLNWGVSPEEAEALKRNAFAIHSKMVTDWPQYAQVTLEISKPVHECLQIIPMKEFWTSVV